MDKNREAFEKWYKSAEGTTPQPLADSEAVAGKYCEWCKSDTHNDAECWCTRPAGWKPTKQPTEIDLSKCSLTPPAINNT